MIDSIKERLGPYASHQVTSTNSTVDGWVLYDSSCGACSRWVPFWAPTLRRIRLGVASLQAPWVGEKLSLPTDELLADIRILFDDGRQVAGPDVYRYVMRRVWWALPFYLFAAAPGTRRVFDAAYRTFAKHRHQISATCGLSEHS
jgi:predicted DCC family thiol-disulfide oxidoreductase YuxK